MCRADAARRSDAGSVHNLALPVWLFTQTFDHVVAVGGAGDDLLLRGFFERVERCLCSRQGEHPNFTRNEPRRDEPSCATSIRYFCSFAHGLLLQILLPRLERRF